VRDLFALGSDERVALHGLDLDIAAGERIALIGPNGAGKSTTVKLCCGILSPTDGTLTIGGRRPHLERRAHVRGLGVVFGQRTQLWWDLAVREAFELLAAIFQVSPDDYRTRLDELSSLLELGPLLGAPVRELSLGQRMRCDIAAALLHAPPLLLLDEPTIGLDVAVKRRIRTFLRSWNAERGTTLLLTTHDLSDVEALSDRILLLDKGRLIFDDSPAALKERLGGGRELVLHLETAPDDPEALVAALPEPARWAADGTVRLALGEATAAPPALVAEVLRRCAARGLSVRDLALEAPAIDDVVASFYEDRGLDS